MIIPFRFDNIFYIIIKLIVIQDWQLIQVDCQSVRHRLDVAIDLAANDSPRRQHEPEQHRAGQTSATTSTSGNAISGARGFSETCRSLKSKPEYPKVNRSRAQTRVSEFRFGRQQHPEKSVVPRCCWFRVFRYVGEVFAVRSKQHQLG